MISRLETRRRNWTTLWGQFMAGVMLFNLLLIGFDLTYLSLRSVYLEYWPAIVTRYDAVKAIRPHPTTQQYLQTLQALEELTLQQPDDSAVPSPEMTATLADLRQQSSHLVEAAPVIFLEDATPFVQLQQQIQRQFDTSSTAAALDRLWSEAYYAQLGPSEFLSVTDQLRSPLQSTYTRTINRHGQPVDYFWRLDLGFSIFFGLEFLAWTYAMSHRQPLTWRDALLRYWYNGLLLLPFWRWLRAIPAIARLHQSNLVNLDQILTQITHEPAVYLSDRAATFMLVRLINQTQDSIKQGDAVQVLLRSGQYIQVNDIDKVNAITDRLLQLLLYRVIPKLESPLGELLQRSIRGVFSQSDFYRNLRQFPGIAQVMTTLPEGAIEQLVEYFAQAVYQTLATAYADAENRELLDQLTQDFKRVLYRELQDKATQEELATLVADLLEELKLNYVQEATQRDPSATSAEVDRIQQEVLS